MSNIILKEYGQTNIIFNKDKNGVWFNAAEVAQLFNKKPSNWLRTKDAIKFLYATYEENYPSEFSKLKYQVSDMRLDIDFNNLNAVDTNIFKDVAMLCNLFPKLIQIRHGGNNPGTWFNEELAVYYAQWLNKKFAVWVSKTIKEIAFGNKQNLIFNNLLRDIPSEWRGIFPSDFFVGVMSLYGRENYDRKRDGNTPMYVGMFIKNYVYDYIAIGLNSECKARLQKHAFDTNTPIGIYKHYQFLREEAKEPLERHIYELIGMMTNKSIEQFKRDFNQKYYLHNQCKLSFPRQTKQLKQATIINKSELLKVS